MGLYYEKADEGVERLVLHALEQYHRELLACDVRVDLLMVSKVDKEGESKGHALKHGGYPAAATVKIVPLKQRALGNGDALITIDSESWEFLDPEQQEALVDHELEHIQVVSANGPKFCHMNDAGELVGEAKRDDHGRPKLKLRKHDWQLGGFTSIAKRHGANAVEVMAIERCRNEQGQYFWDWSALVLAHAGA